MRTRGCAVSRLEWNLARRIDLLCQEDIQLPSIEDRHMRSRFHLLESAEAKIETLLADSFRCKAARPSFIIPFRADKFYSSDSAL